MFANSVIGVRKNDEAPGKRVTCTGRIQDLLNGSRGEEDLILIEEQRAATFFDDQGGPIDRIWPTMSIRWKVGVPLHR